MSKKSQSMVTYDNDLNMIALKGMSQVENDVFFALLYKLKNQNTNEVILDFSELKTLIGFEDQKNEYIRASILNIAEKIAKSVVKYVDENETQFFTLFQILAVPNNDDYYIRAKISEPFAYLLNELKKTFTAFDIAEFSALSSKYTQTIYRLLKQFRFTGILKIDWEKFKALLDIPKSYQNSDIERRILKPSIKELGQETSLFNQTNPIFKNLKYEKEYYPKRGRPVKSIKFTFTPETSEPNEIQEQFRELREIRQKEIQNAPAIETRLGVFGGEVSDLNGFIGKYCYFKNKFDGGSDSCKIINLENLANGKLRATIKNQENEKIFYMEFETLQHLKNSLSL